MKLVCFRTTSISQLHSIPEFREFTKDADHIIMSKSDSENIIVEYTGKECSCGENLVCMLCTLMSGFVDGRSVKELQWNPCSSACQSDCDSGESDDDEETASDSEESDEDEETDSEESDDEEPDWLTIYSLDLETGTTDIITREYCMTCEPMESENESDSESESDSDLK